MTTLLISFLLSTTNVTPFTDGSILVVGRHGDKCDNKGTTSSTRVEWLRKHRVRQRNFDFIDSFGHIEWTLWWTPFGHLLSVQLVIVRLVKALQICEALRTALV